MTFNIGRIARFFRSIENLQKAPSAQVSTSKSTYTVRNEQTPQTIAKVLGHRDGGRAIAAANDLRLDQKLEAGVVLVIPKLEAAAEPPEAKFDRLIAAQKKKFEANGYEYQIKIVEPTSDNGDVRTVKIVDQSNGKVIAAHYEDFQHGATTSKFNEDGTGITEIKYSDGASSRTVSDAKTGETTTRVEDPKLGKATERVSFNGYTLTTAADGTSTLLKETDDTRLTLKPGTPELSLAQTLLKMNPNSNDPAKAKEGIVAKTAIDAMLLGQNYNELDAAAKAASKETKAAIEKYGVGQTTQPTEPKAPSGKEWVQVGGLWMDPEVARAMAAENTAAASLIETQAKIDQATEQLNVYALDPAYSTAIRASTKILDEALAPHDLRWEKPAPLGTLKQARQRLSVADKQVVAASGTSKEYAEAERLTREAVAKTGTLPPPIAKGGTYVSAPGYNRGEAIVDRNAKKAEVDDLFARANTYTARGDQSFADYLVGMKQQRLDATKPATTENKKARQELDNALKQQKQASENVRAGETYGIYYSANKQLTALQQKAEGTKQKIIAEHRKDYPDLHDWEKEYTTYGGDYLGKIQKQDVVEDPKDHQLYLETTYEHGDPKRVQLTFARNDKRVSGELKDRELNKEWQNIVEGPESLCGAGSLEAAQKAAISAMEDIKKIEINNLDLQLEALRTDIPQLKKARDDALAKYGGRRPEPSSGTTSNGTEPPALNGAQAPAQQSEHPEVSNAQRALDMAIAQEDSTERALEEARQARNRLDFALSQPIKLLVDAASDSYGKDSEYAYLDKRRQQALGEYQLKIEDLYHGGYTEHFKVAKTGEGLDTTVAGVFGLEVGSDADTVGKITAEIREIGGDSAQYKIIPMFHVSEQEGSQQTALIAVKESDARVYYVDVTGKKFESLGDFQDNNSQFAEGDRLVVPRGLDMRRGRDSTIPLEVVDARNFTVTEKVIDPVVGSVTSVAAVASFVPPLTPVAAPVAMTGGAYLGGRAIVKQVNHLQHGGEWGDTESLMNMGAAASSFIPMGAGGLRTFGTFRAVPEMSLLQAGRGSIGALRPNTPLALKSAEYMSNGGLLNRASRMLDWTSLGIGVPMTAVSVHDIAAHGSEMKGIDIFNAVAGVATGTVGTAFGTRGLLMTRPRKGGAEDGGTTPVAAPQPPTNLRPSTPDEEGVLRELNGFVEFANSQPRPRSLSAAGREKEPIDLWNDYRRHMGNDPDAASERVLRNLYNLSNPANSDLLQTGGTAEPIIGKVTYSKPEITADTAAEDIGALMPGQLARLEPRELESLSPDQVAGITRANKAKLNDAQLAALERASPASGVDARQLIYSTPDDVSLAAFVDRAARLGVSREAAESLYQPMARDDVTGFCDARVSGLKSAELRRAQDHVSETGEPAFFVSADIANLGGLNQAMQNRAERANAHYRALAKIFGDSLAERGGTVVPMRVGGDEIAAVVIGVEEGHLNSAIEAANERIQTYVRESGLSDIVNPKRPTERGVGLHIGYAEILPDLPPASIFDQADLGIDRSKNRSKQEHVTGEQRRAVGTDRADPGAAQAAYRGTGTEIRRRTSGGEIKTGHTESSKGAGKAPILDQTREVSALSRPNPAGSTGRAGARSVEGTYVSPDDVSLAAFVDRAARLGVSREAAGSLYQPMARDDVTGFYDARVSGLKLAELRRAQDHVSETGEPAFFVSADIANLGGLNQAMQNRAERANAHYRALARIFRASLAEQGGTVVPMRVGGDEIAAVVIGVEEGHLNSAIEAANERIQTYVRESGLSDIVNPKRPTERGVGLHIGYAEILPDLPPASIFDQADLGVDRSKNRSKQEHVTPLSIRGASDDNAPAESLSSETSTEPSFRFAPLQRLTRDKAAPGTRDHLLKSGLPVVEDPAGVLYLPRAGTTRTISGVSHQAPQERLSNAAQNVRFVTPLPASPERAGPFQTAYPVRKSEYPLQEWMAEYIPETGLFYTEARKVDAQWIYKPNHDRRDQSNSILISPDIYVVSAFGTRDALFDLQGAPVTAIMDRRRRLITPHRLVNRLSEHFGLDEKSYTPGQPIALLAEYTAAGGRNSYAQQLATEAHAPVYGLIGDFNDRQWALFFPDPVTQPVIQPNFEVSPRSTKEGQAVRARWTLLEKRESADLEVLSQDDSVKIDRFLAPQGAFVINAHSKELLSRGPQHVAASAREAGYSGDKAAMLLTLDSDEGTHKFARDLAEALGGPVLIMTDDGWRAGGNAIAKNTITVSRVEGAENRRISIDESGHVSFLDTQENREAMIWLNFGPLERSRSYFERKRGQMDDVRLHLFDVPKSALENIRQNAVRQADAQRDGNTKKPVMGDWLESPDQFGLRWDQAKELEELVVPGSTRTLGSLSEAPPEGPPVAINHPLPDELGRLVTITSPTQPSGPATWTDASQTAIFTPRGDFPNILNNVPMMPWQPPTTAKGWQGVPGHNPRLAEPPAHDGIRKAGTVIVEPDGRTWVIESTNHFAGARTFPKGSVEEGLSLQTTAIKEAYEETGLHVELIAHLIDQTPKGSKTTTRYYLARRIGGTPVEMGWETQGVYLVPKK
ncbi:NUDIX domain-containing protein [Sinorhizobium fredii]|uniref:Nudix hydrolase domain-containing protein n=1 Tax=Sinorhizobium fredii (strain USDA 257) TaxID=1185652 RepID=I3X550_SINF2|nr:NUDIX domain-containing protein [Sinorhizobium fredii]AFL51006.1 hypothetical protein USDA257_c24300 [Sinorhizobium fredii USDA 257]